MFFFHNFKKIGSEKPKLVILNKLVTDGNWKNNAVRKKNEIGLQQQRRTLFFLPDKLAILVE